MIVIVHSIYSQAVHAPALNAGLMDNDAERYCTNPLFLAIEVLPLRKYFFHKVRLVMYKYSNHLLPECVVQLYLRNDSIHEHNTRGSQLLRVPPGSKTFSNLSARI